MANFKQKLGVLVATGALALGVTGAAVAATSNDDGAANGLRVVQTEKKANGLKANGLRANGL